MDATWELLLERSGFRLRRRGRFLVVDLVVASILASLGMQALSPIAVSLPFKLLLFVTIDGLRTLIDALVAGYR